MTALRRLSPALAALLLALVMVGRVAVPTGWMPSLGSEGIEIRLCTGQGPATMILDLGHEAPEEPRDPCPYALAAPAFPLPPAVAAVPIPTALAERPAALPQAPPPPASAPHSLPPPTGPPAFA